jgi:hypothetical protein
MGSESSQRSHQSFGKRFAAIELAIEYFGKRFAAIELAIE